MNNKYLISEFGKRVRELRLDMDLSQEKLSFITGFHRTYIGMIERGERNISLSNLAVFSKAFGINLSELLNNNAINTVEKYETKVQE